MFDKSELLQDESFEFCLHRSISQVLCSLKSVRHPLYNVNMHSKGFLLVFFPTGLSDYN